MSDSAAAANNNTADNWRSSVLQSYRNAEVREIAKVLAALEGSGSVTPASKLMLAMRFEDQIFKSANSLADYRKKISKRLKKLKKNYVAPTKVPIATTTTAADNNGEDNAAEKDELKIKLRNAYGENLRYIVKNSTAALADLKKKLGSEKARQLQQHTDSCRIWCRDLEVMTEEELVEATAAKVDDDDKEGKGKNPNTTTTTTTVSNKPVLLSLAQVQRIEKHLQTRVGNIRSYVVKHADPDQFLLETLQSKDKAFSKNVEAGNLFREILMGQISSQRDLVQKHKEKSKEEQKQNKNKKQQQQQSTDETTTSTDDDDAITILQRAVEKAQAGVPPPTRNDSKQIEASLRHLDKMRAASTAMMTYWTLKGDERLATAPRNTLKKIHDVVQEGTDFVIAAVKEREKQQSEQRHGGSSSRVGDGDQARGNVDSSSNISTNSRVSLQDAWSKMIELPSSATVVECIGDDSDIINMDSKRLRSNSYRPYYKVRKLFHPQRKTPTALLSAIRRKGARLCVPSSTSVNSIYLVLDFDEAFTMTIYMSPLTVTLRARAPEDTDDSSNGGNPSPAAATTATWLPLSHGLTPSSTTKNSFGSQNNTQQRQLSVWGVTSTYDSIGRVVEERLRDASTHATATLRKCFQNHVKDKSVDFEVELLEGSALLEYLQVVRATYMPHWEDTD
ncbi:MAG: hypothetical protein ACI8RD_007023 [Bacillariaceae sp.]|jgi:hypothetical protein